MQDRYDHCSPIVLWFVQLVTALGCFAFGSGIITALIWLFS